MELKFGACLSWEYVDLLKKAGGDFVELPLAKVAQLEIRDFEELSRNLPLPAEVFNIFLPSSIKIIGPEVDWLKIKDYLLLALPRAKRLGCEVVVFGSGGARRAPENFPNEESKTQLLSFLSLASEIANEEGLLIAIEPLNSSETNTINTLREALQLAKELDRENVGVIADIYHLLREGEGLETIEEAGEKLFHIHISDPERNPPLKEDSILRDFMRVLKKVNYQRRISIESRWNDLEEELPQAIKALKNLWEVSI